MAKTKHKKRPIQKAVSKLVIERQKPLTPKKAERLIHQTCVRFTDLQWKLVNKYAKTCKQDLATAIRLSVLYFANAPGLRK